MVFEDGEEKIANLGALFFSALSLLFMLIGTIGASTLFTPGDETSAMPELSMLRWHPVGAIQYFFGLTRAVYQRREVNEDADDGGFDDDTDDEFNWYFNVLEYKDCKDTGGTLSGVSFSADMCNECYEAGLKTKDILTSICILFFLLRFAAPMVVMALPTSSVKQQLLPIVSTEDWWWNEAEARKGSKTINGVDNYLTYNYNHGPVMIWRVIHVLGPFVFMIMMSSAVASFTPCIDAIKDEYDDEDSMYDGGAIAMLITTAVFLALSSVLYLVAAIISMRTGAARKKRMEMWRLEPEGGVNDVNSGVVFNQEPAFNAEPAYTPGFASAQASNPSYNSGAAVNYGAPPPPPSLTFGSAKATDVQY